MPLFTPGGLQTRQQFRDQLIGELLTITGDTRLLWTPKSTDTTTSTDESLNGRTLTADATMAAQLEALGLGYARTMNGSSNYLTTPDAADLSFGNGTTDQPFSAIVVANVTNTAGIRQFLSKYGALGSGTGAEWYFEVYVDDTIVVEIFDDSAGVSCYRKTDAAITMGSPAVFGFSYSGVGGASAGNGITIYQQGLAFASTAANSGSYVAMENKTAPVEVGSYATHSAGYFQGAYPLAVLSAKNLSASEHWAAAKLLRAYFGF